MKELFGRFGRIRRDNDLTREDALRLKEDAEKRYQLIVNKRRAKRKKGK